MEKLSGERKFNQISGLFAEMSFASVVKGPGKVNCFVLPRASVRQSTLKTNQAAVDREKVHKAQCCD